MSWRRRQQTGVFCPTESARSVPSRARWSTLIIRPQWSATLREVATRPVLRSFISSTAVDLRDCRDKVRDAVLRLESLLIAMETFSALPGQPVGECILAAAAPDAVICIVAHRYGYVPPAELGGDGARSITWIEEDAATCRQDCVCFFLRSRMRRSIALA